MSALIILFVLGVWGAVLYNTGYYASFAIGQKWIRQTLGVAVVMGVTMLVLWDEIQGSKEFETFCISARSFQIPVEVAGKLFEVQFTRTEDVALPNSWRPTWQFTSTYTDVASGKKIATGQGYRTTGGWLVRKIGMNPMNGGNSPLFGSDFCYPSKYPDQALRLRKMINIQVK